MAVAALFLSAHMVLLLVCAGVVQAALTPEAWPDCSPQRDGHFPYNGTAGPYGPITSFNATWEKKPLVVKMPSNLPKPAPVLIFMHGLTAEIGMMQKNLNNYASHGFVVIFPYIKGPAQDKKPFTTNSDGTYILHALDFVRDAANTSSSPLFGKVDVSNVVVAGHSMGATDTIMFGITRKSLLQDPSIKLVIAQHPGICGPFGPPPVPYTWTKADLQTVASSKPLLFTTATNDNAFWPAPETAAHEYGCFTSALDGHPGVHSATYIQFSKAACLQDGANPPFDDGGHDCTFKTGVETPWVTTAIKFYAQQNANPGSACKGMLYGTNAKADNSSISLDPQVERVLVLAQ